MPNAIEMRRITKRYGALVANDEIDLTITRGEIHAVVGENGAGKTTLMHVLSGLVRPEGGEVRVNGAPLRLGDPGAASKAGVGLVAQHLSLIAPFTAWENVVLGAEPSGWVGMDRSRAFAATDALAKELGVAFPLDQAVEDLSFGMRQTIEIMKALYRGAKILVLDEPTSTLPPPEAERLFALIHKLRERGTTILLVTHRIQEVLDHAMKATVLRDGRVAHCFDREEIDSEMLVEAILGGRGVPFEQDRDPVRSDETLLEVEGLTTSLSGQVRLEELELTVRRGEILGIAGVAENGQHALAGAITGTLPIESGQIRLAGKEITRASVGSRRMAGLAYIPEDRHTDGIIADFTVADNLVLGRQRQFSQVWGLDRVSMETYARSLVERFDIRSQGLQQQARDLSGGNQQKLVVARELGSDPLFVVASDPTRGLDFESTAFVHRALKAVRDQGSSALIFSSDLEELLSLSDRVAVICRGRIVGIQSREAFDVPALGRLMTGAA